MARILKPLFRSRHHRETRLCGRLKADGRDVGQILIAEGLAERYTCWGSSCPRRKDWCAG